MRSFFLILLLLVINIVLSAQAVTLKPAVEFNSQYSSGMGSIKKLTPGDGIKLYPNPAFDFITILTGDSGDYYKIEVFDITGKKVISSSPETKITTLDLREIHPGIYMVRLSGKDRVVTRRIIKK